MKYKVGDKVRISKCNVEILKGQIDVIEEVYPRDNSYKLSRFDIRIAESNLRPTEFKIWCETKEEKQAVLEELEKEGYTRRSSGEKPTKCIGSKPKCGLYVRDRDSGLTISYDKDYFNEDDRVELTPSEFTGIDFSKKIIITKTTTGAMATYGDKTVTTDGDFEDASRQALAEVLCPFKVGDKVIDKRCKNKGIVTEIRINGEVVVHLDDESGDYDMAFKTLELLEPYVEPLYNAKLFCIKGHGLFKQGVVYTVENGVFIGVHDSHYKDLEDINKKLCSQFMEVKGGLDD